MPLTWRSLLSLLSLFLLLPAQVSAQGNTQCRGPDFDWYTKNVGETPCRTYERLRQICDGNYRVGTMSRERLPGDRCDSQVSACCCNSVAFALSMLCTNCQRVLNDGVGLDAPKGTYQEYLKNAQGCSNPTSQGLAPDIQQGVCRAGIKIPETLYGIFWHDGAWFNAFTRQASETSFNTKGDAAIHQCPAPSPPPPPPVTPGTTSSSTNRPADTQPADTRTPDNTQTGRTTTSTSTTPAVTTRVATVTTTNAAGETVIQTSTSAFTNTAADPANTNAFNNGQSQENGGQQKEADETEPSGALGGGAIAGISFGGVAFLGLLLFGLFILVRRRRRQAVLLEQDVQPYSFSGRPHSDFSSVPGHGPAGWSSSSRSGPNQYPPYRDPVQSMHSEASLIHGNSVAYGGFTSPDLTPVRYGQSVHGSSAYSASERPLSPTTTNTFSVSERESDAGPAVGRLPPIYDERWRGSERENDSQYY